MNTTNKVVHFDRIHVKTEPLSNFHIFKANFSNTETRFRKLLQIINIETGDEKAKNTLKGIINKYQNIFHLKEEKLTVNNFLQPRYFTNR